jgi:hypothetical protein
MARDDEPIRPMTLGNMRQNGVRGLFVTCGSCCYHSEINVDAWPDDVPVPSFGPRMRCRQVRQARRDGETELERAGGPITGQRPAMTGPRFSVEQRQALELLASDPQGATEELLVLAHGFDSDMIAGLVRRGLAMARRENMKAGSGTPPQFADYGFMTKGSQKLLLLRINFSTSQ